MANGKGLRALWEVFGPRSHYRGSLSPEWGAAVGESQRRKEDTPGHSLARFEVFVTPLRAYHRGSQGQTTHETLAAKRGRRFLPWFGRGVLTGVKPLCAMNRPRNGSRIHHRVRDSGKGSLEHALGIILILLTPFLPVL